MKAKVRISNSHKQHQKEDLIIASGKQTLLCCETLIKTLIRLSQTIHILLESTF